jgi:hypothetical protein
MLFGSILRVTLFLVSLFVFGLGGCLFMVGILMSVPAAYYSGIAFVAIPLPLLCYLGSAIQLSNR